MFQKEAYFHLLFNILSMKIHSKLNKFKIKKLDCYIVPHLRFLLEILQAILPETSPFLSSQMAVLSSFFQIFMVLGMYNIDWDMQMQYTY